MFVGACAQPPGTGAPSTVVPPGPHSGDNTDGELEEDIDVDIDDSHGDEEYVPVNLLDALTEAALDTSKDLDKMCFCTFVSSACITQCKRLTFACDVVLCSR